MKTNWQDPQTSEIRSTHISGLQDAVGKIEDILEVQLEAETGVTLTEVYISDTDRYRIYQAPLGKRNWAASPAPVIYKNGVQITSGFTIDYGGGAIILSPAATSTDVFTADFSRVKTDGGNRLDKHLTDAINVKAFGASGSTQTTTGDITAGSAELTLASAIDFENGQGITVNHAGAACTLATPGAPTVTPTGTAGTTEYQYQIVALDDNGGCTAASAAGVTTTGNATLDATNYNALSWTAVSGATAYAVYGRVSGTMQLLAIVSGTTWNDKGTAAITPPSTLPSSPPASALADTLVTTIVSGGGTTTLTLATTATTTATAQVVGHDDTAAIQAAIDYVNTEFVGGTIYFPTPSVYYKVSGKLILHSNITLLGGNGAYIYNNTETAEPVIEIVGTAENRLKNIKLENLKIRNGTASTDNYTIGKDGIEVKYCDGFEMTGCEVTEIQGVCGLSTRYSTDIWVKENRFYRCTYSHFSVLPECENIHVEGNIFDTCTSLTYANTYLFATGGDATIDDWACKNLWVKDNRFLNNPRWEAIDSHGCENMWIEDNYVINCKTAVMVGGGGDFVVNKQSSKNIHIEKNIFIQGTGENDLHGVYVSGTVEHPTENVTIRGNEIVGFGSTTAGAIMFQHVSSGDVSENTLRDYRHIGICPGGGNINVQVHHNHFKDNASDALGSAIYVRNYGNIKISIEDNDSYPSSDAVSPQYFIRNQSGRYNNITVKNNTYIGNTVKYTGILCAGFSPTVNLNSVALFYMCKGDTIYDVDEKPLFIVTAPEKGHAGNRPLNKYVFSGVSGSNILTLDTYVPSATLSFGLGCNITIPLSEGSMNAIITKIHENYIEIDQNLPEDIVSQEIYNAVATWSRTQMTDIQGSTTWDPGSLADGAGETSAAITVTGAAFGDYVLVSAPYDLQGITCNGYVSAANTVKIRLQNETGGTIDLASGTWKVKVIKA